MLGPSLALVKGMTKQHTTLLLTLPLVFLASEIASAEVNLQEGSFNLERLDKIHFSSNESLGLTRSYSSRSTYRGLLDLGWCSQIEWKFFAKSRTLQKCDDLELIEPTQIQTKKDVVLVRTSPNQTLHFNARADLIAIEQKGKRYAFMRDLSGRATTILSPTGLPAAISTSPVLQRLTKIGSAGGVLSFSFEQNQLSQVQDITNPQTKETYRYDDDSNMTFASSPVLPEMNITYDRVRDRVLSVQQALCTQHYLYRTVDLAVSVLDHIEITQVCQGQKRQVASTTYNYEKTTAGEILLTKISQDQKQ